jgi:hypothetical protein
VLGRVLDIISNRQSDGFRAIVGPIFFAAEAFILLLLFSTPMQNSGTR